MPNLTYKTLQLEALTYQDKHNALSKRSITLAIARYFLFIFLTKLCRRCVTPTLKSPIKITRIFKA